MVWEEWKAEPGTAPWGRESEPRRGRKIERLEKERLDLTPTQQKGFLEGAGRYR